MSSKLVISLYIAASHTAHLLYICLCIIIYIRLFVAVNRGSRFGVTLTYVGDDALNHSDEVESIDGSEFSADRYHSYKSEFWVECER